MPTITPIQDQEVEISEQGSLKNDVDESLAVAGGTQDQNTFTVPTGKKWVLKAINAAVTAGSLSELYARITPASGGNFDITQTLFGTLSSSNTLILPISITLTQGDAITVFTKAAALGNHYKKLLYIELDE